MPSFPLRNLSKSYSSTNSPFVSFRRERLTVLLELLNISKVDSVEHLQAGLVCSSLRERERETLSPTWILSVFLVALISNGTPLLWPYWMWKKSSPEVDVLTKFLLPGFGLVPLVFWQIKKNQLCVPLSSRLVDNQLLWCISVPEFGFSFWRLF